MNPEQKPTDNPHESAKSFMNPGQRPTHLIYFCKLIGFLDVAMKKVTEL